MPSRISPNCHSSESTNAVIASAARKDFERFERFDKTSRRFLVSESIRIDWNHKFPNAGYVLQHSVRKKTHILSDRQQEGHERQPVEDAMRMISNNNSRARSPLPGSARFPDHSREQ